jgi:ABC-type transporter Mla maintaining outer membrane lipid asymmetry ATPase subunit MlaF
MTTKVYDNVTLTVEGGKLLIEIDGNKRLGQSKTGKSTIVATTKGNVQIGLPSGEVLYLGVNAYVK